jgi:hypothetical protein
MIDDLKGEVPHPARAGCVLRRGAMVTWTKGWGENHFLVLRVSKAYRSPRSAGENGKYRGTAEPSYCVLPQDGQKCEFFVIWLCKKLALYIFQLPEGGVFIHHQV